MYINTLYVLGVLDIYDCLGSLVRFGSENIADSFPRIIHVFFISLFMLGSWSAEQCFLGSALDICEGQTDGLLTSI